MAIDLAHELWQELRRYVPSVDLEDAAETVVNVLVDNGHDADEIMEVFKNDALVRRVVTDLFGTDSESYEDDFDDEDDDEYMHEDDY